MPYANPTVPDDPKSTIGLVKILAQILQAGLGEDRSREWLGAEKPTVGVASAALTIPAGTDLVHLQVGAGDIHLSMEPAGSGIAATANHGVYKAGVEYWLGPFSAVPDIRHIRSVGDSVCTFEYWKRS